MGKDEHQWSAPAMSANQLSWPAVHRATDQLPVEGHLPSFGGAAEWLNSQPLTAGGLRGLVVLVQFWTYTCINWLRTLGYVRAWAAKYEDHGLVVVGVHTPEFPFEHDIDNVRLAAKDMLVKYPIALDNGYVVWRAFSNRYWPAVYIADAEGQIRHHQFGEGGYEECERTIQRLLGEVGGQGIPDDLVSVAGEGFEAQADWTNLKSPESYLGYEQAVNFASLGGAELDQPRTYVAPDPLKLNHWALSGDWTVAGRASVLNRTGGQIAFASTPAMSISSWAPVREGPPYNFESSSIDSRPGPRAGSMLTTRATAWFPSRGSTSSSVNPGPSLGAPSKSLSLILAFRPMRLPSARSERNMPVEEPRKEFQRWQRHSSDKQRRRTDGRRPGAHPRSAPKV